MTGDTPVLRKPPYIRAVLVPHMTRDPIDLQWPRRLPIPLKEGLRYEVELLRCVSRRRTGRKPLREDELAKVGGFHSYADTPNGWFIKDHSIKMG